MPHAEKPAALRVMPGAMFSGTWQVERRSVERLPCDEGWRLGPWNVASTGHKDQHEAEAALEKLAAEG